MKHHSSVFPVEHLYRKQSVCLLVLILASVWLISPVTNAQSKKQKGPRALGVVAWSGNSDTPDPATSVLDPVAIYVEGHFFDATIYQAQPEPLAVDSGVVYDVLKTGDPLGTFTLGRPREQDGLWYGIGRYEPKEAAVAPKSSPPVPKTNAEPEDERPRLRRGTPPPPAPKEQTDVVLNNIDRDPERPTLRRHSPGEKKTTAPEVPLNVPPTHLLPAISTESGPDYRPFHFREKPGELDELRGAMEKLARAELAKETKRPATTTSSPTLRGRAHAPVSPPAIQFTNVKFGVYDVNSDNAPILVYSGTAQVDGAKKYVTVAAWEEIDQSLRKVFAQVTDDRHLDIYPRLEIIDAVDARGNERGELLFRAFGDQGSRFILYHPGPDSLEVLFDSAHGES